MLPLVAPLPGTAAAADIVQVAPDDLEQLVSPRRRFQRQELRFLPKKVLQGAGNGAIPLVTAAI